MTTQIIEWLKLNNVHPGWLEWLPDVNPIQLKIIMDNLQQEKEDYEGIRQIFPPHNQIWRVFQMNPLDIRVVLIGQDPYINPGQAMGLSFSVPSGTPPPPSLQNIFKELAQDIGGEVRTNPDLTDWFNQGVFMINQSLTVREGKSNSHATWWKPFMHEFWREFWIFIKHPVVIWCWGKDAEKAIENLPKEHPHLILRAPHPSPLSAYRGFFGSRPFSQTNDFLGKKIIWNTNE